MIFSIVCEELGVFGGLIIIALFGYLLYRLFFIAQNAPDFYGLNGKRYYDLYCPPGYFKYLRCVTGFPPQELPFPLSVTGGTSVCPTADVGIALSVSRKIKLMNKRVDKYRKRSIYFENQNIK